MTHVLQQATTIVEALQKVRDEALHHGRTVTEKGKGIDDHQVHAERLAYLATEVEAARALLTYAQAAQGQGDAETGEMALGFAAEVGHKLLGQADIHLADFGFAEAFLADTLGRVDVKAAIRAGTHESRFRQIGRSVITNRGINNSWLESEIALMTRDSVRQFARSEVSPVAEQVHRQPWFPRFHQRDEGGHVADVVPERVDVEALAVGLTATAQIQRVHRQPIGDQLLSRPRVVRAVGIEARNDHDRRSRCETRTPGAEEDLKACAVERSLARDHSGHRLHLWPAL